MLKFILSVFLIAILTTSGYAQKNITYPVVVSFNSMCCGVPDKGPVMKLISSFKKQNRIKRITADSIGPMGKEGEYYLAFSLKELSKAQKIKFIQRLKKIVPTLKDQGSAALKENFTIDKAELSSRVTITSLKL